MNYKDASKYPGCFIFFNFTQVQTLRWRYLVHVPYNWILYSLDAKSVIK
jgi:hypothetical protein